jgi:hypothetical protein
MINFFIVIFIQKTTVKYSCFFDTCVSFFSIIFISKRDVEHAESGGNATPVRKFIRNLRTRIEEAGRRLVVLLVFDTGYVVERNR